ncbi:MAG: DUF924 domain-containing protein [Proteobacteria bacterium]|nr:DUF924 domain-containing protein [Pseudomonadota bacterium]
MDEALKVREFWFGKSLTGLLPGQGGLASQAVALKHRVDLWFDRDPQAVAQQDETIRTQFQYLVERAVQGELDAWADSPRRRLSLIIVLDQFPRQIYRGTAQAFAYDPAALALTLSGMQLAADGALNLVERLFFYMPLQHAEATEVQDESVAAYKRLVAESPAELRSTFEASLESAEQHRELIRQFGRFPHRNKVLGRENTPEEVAYFKKGGDTFGQ